jgi:hypothetical protein
MNQARKYVKNLENKYRETIGKAKKKIEIVEKTHKSIERAFSIGQNRNLLKDQTENGGLV